MKLHLPALLSRPLCIFASSWHPNAPLQALSSAGKIARKLAQRGAAEMEVVKVVEVEVVMEVVVENSPEVRLYQAANARTPLVMPHSR